MLLQLRRMDDQDSGIAHTTYVREGDDRSQMLRERHRLGKENIRKRLWDERCHYPRFTRECE